MDIFYFMQNAASLQGGIWKFFRKNGSNLFFCLPNCLPELSARTVCQTKEGFKIGMF